MKKFLTLSIASLALLYYSCTNGQTQTSKTNLSAIDFAEKIKTMPEAPVVDVRTPDEFSKGHLINAKNIDWNGNDFDKQIASIDKSKPVFVYCLSGGRSGSAAGLSSDALAASAAAAPEVLHARFPPRRRRSRFRSCAPVRRPRR